MLYVVKNIYIKHFYHKILHVQLSGEQHNGIFRLCLNPTIPRSTCFCIFFISHFIKILDLGDPTFFNQYQFFIFSNFFSLPGTKHWYLSPSARPLRCVYRTTWYVIIFKFIFISFQKFSQIKEILFVQI